MCFSTRGGKEKDRGGCGVIVLVKHKRSFFYRFCFDSI